MGGNQGDNLFHKILKEYGGAIIGGVVALLLCFTEIYKLLLCVAVMLTGIIIGTYIQKNESKVKEKIKELINKIKDKF